MTGAEMVVKTLEKNGVKVVFGYPGAANCPIIDKLSFSSIKHILTRNEQGAAHMASGYARVTKQAGVCTATSGPGATNLITVSQPHIWILFRWLHLQVRLLQS